MTKARQAGLIACKGAHLAWLGLAGLAVAGYLSLAGWTTQAANLSRSTPAATAAAQVTLPALLGPETPEGIFRQVEYETLIPRRPRVTVARYTVQKGDTAWSIGEKFGLQPETILWGNESLSSEAGSLYIGAELNILPLDGVLHTVAQGDTL